MSSGSRAGLPPCPGSASIEQGGEVLRGLLVLHQVRQKERGKTPATIQPIAGVGANEACAEPGVAFELVGGDGDRGGTAECAALQAPKNLVHAHVECPDGPVVVGGDTALGQGAVDLGLTNIHAALEAVIDEEVGVEVGNHRGVRLHGGQGRTHPREGTGMVGERPWS